MEKFLRQTGEKALIEAANKGVKAEAYLLNDKELSVEVVDGQVEALKQADEMGMGVRVIKDNRIGFAFTSDFSDEAIKRAVEDAVRISRYTDQDEYNILPQKAGGYPDIVTFDEETAGMSMEDKINLAISVEHAARAVDKRISIVERAGYDDVQYSCVVMNTSGLYAYETGNYSGIYIFLVAEDENDAQNGFSMMTERKVKNLSPAFVGKEAANNAVRALKARTIKSKRLPVVLDPYVATRFLTIVGSMVNAESVQKGKSMFAGKTGQAVAAKVLTITDDGTMENAVGSSPFDGEGVPSRKTAIIDKGILKSFLYDSYNAAKVGTISTGNGQRASFRNLPSVGISNFVIQPGKHAPELLYSGLKEGLYVTEVMGMHTANPISGDFSVGAAGIMIEKGELAYSVRGITIAGNMMEFLQGIDAVGSDLRFYGSKASPSIRVAELSVAGE